MRARSFCGLCGRMLPSPGLSVGGRRYCAEHHRLIERGEHIPPDPLCELPTLAAEAERLLEGIAPGDSPDTSPVSSGDRVATSPVTQRVGAGAGQNSAVLPQEPCTAVAGGGLITAPGGESPVSGARACA